MDKKYKPNMMNDGAARKTIGNCCDAFSYLMKKIHLNELQKSTIRLSAILTIYLQKLNSTS